MIGFRGRGTESLEMLASLKAKKIKITEVPKWGRYLRMQWENHFASELSDKEKKSIFLHDHDGACGYLWHIFSYERRAHLKENEADIALNKAEKRYCYVFYQHSDDAFILEHAKALTANDLTNEEDIYIVDKEYSWTYVKTHETGWCGPYFCQKEKRNGF